MDRAEFEFRLWEKSQEPELTEMPYEPFEIVITRDTPKTKTMRHNLQLIGIYRLPGDKPLIHNGKAYRK